MRKTTVYLNDDEAEALRQLAAATGTSQAELIRQAVRRAVAQPPDRQFHSLGRGATTGQPPFTLEPVRRVPESLRPRLIGRGPAAGCRALYAQADRADPHPAAVAAILRTEREPLITSALAVAEADYLIVTRLG